MKILVEQKSQRGGALGEYGGMVPPDASHYVFIQYVTDERR